jgi:hypothetical protein
MTTEQLNEYIFAALVEAHMYRRIKLKLDSLVAQGLSEEEIDKQLPPKKDAILASLKNLTTVKEMLFEIPSELDQV